jgi:hypothetical protein
MKPLAALLLTLTLCTRTAPAAEPGFVDLFDGKTLKGWTKVGDRGSGYLVENGRAGVGARLQGQLFTEAEVLEFHSPFRFQTDRGREQRDRNSRAAGGRFRVLRNGDSDSGSRRAVYIAAS